MIRYAVHWRHYRPYCNESHILRLDLAPRYTHENLSSDRYVILSTHIRRTLAVLTQTSKAGGSVQTDVTAVAVTPIRPRPPRSRR